MKRTTKMILGLGTAALLSTAALAYPAGMNTDGCDMKNNHHKMMKMKHHKKGDKIIGAMMKLDLTQDQRDKIDTILKEARDARQSPSVAFTAKDFDKEKFVKLMKEQRETRIEQRAETLGKIYALLDDTQKKDLKTILDMQRLQHKKMAKHQFKGKNCNGKTCNGRG